ncbi:MAG: hypothetical protein IT320_02610 [Anaerolineae bacterium]|nr:hypothetical protein [Anaerolineae bacterium]
MRIWFRSDDGAFTDNSLVRAVYLELSVVAGPEAKRPTIADLEAYLGDPEMIRLASGIESPTVALIYRNDRVNTYVDDLECDKVLPDQEILSIVLFAEPPTNQAWLSQPHEWVDYGYCHNFERDLS